MYRGPGAVVGHPDQIPRKVFSIRQVVRETGISYTTVRKMLDYPFVAQYRDDTPLQYRGDTSPGSGGPGSAPWWRCCR